jgi:hypothetical protein
MMAIVLKTYLDLLLQKGFHIKNHSPPSAWSAWGAS